MVLKPGMSLVPLKENKAIGAELEKLAESLGTDLQHKANLWNVGDEPAIRGELQGFAYAVKLLSHGVGWPGLARVPSISLIVTLLGGNKYRWKMQNVEGMTQIFNVPGEPKHLDEGILLEQSQLDEVLPLELREFLTESSLDYFFHIQLDRIVISTYRAYRHELYLFLLEQMVKTAQALATLA